MTTETRITEASIALCSFDQAVLVCVGRLVDDHPTNPRLKAGTVVRTSEVIAVDGSLVLTKSGTRYRIVGAL